MSISIHEKGFASYIADLMQSVGPVNAKRMFGGHGIFLKLSAPGQGCSKAALSRIQYARQGLLSIFLTGNKTTIPRSGKGCGR